jgi:hypothetical protein
MVCPAAFVLSPAGFHFRESTLRAAAQPAVFDTAGLPV